MNMRAMVLAAGVGSRLQPLTKTIPKALLPFRNKPMLLHVLEYLSGQGITEVLINIHHLADQIVRFAQELDLDIDIRFSDERDMLMDTGGAIMKAQDFFPKDRPFLVHNVDVLTDVDLSEMLDFHDQRQPVATLAIKKRETSRSLLFNDNMLLSGWQNHSTGEKIISRNENGLESFGFSGLHIISPEIFKWLPADIPFSMTKAYLDLAKEQTIIGFDHSSGSWTDMAHRKNFPEIQ